MLFASAYAREYGRSPMEYIKMKPGEKLLMKGFIVKKIEETKR